MDFSGASGRAPDSSREGCWFDPCRSDGTIAFFRANSLAPTHPCLSLCARARVSVCVCVCVCVCACVRV